LMPGSANAEATQIKPSASTPANLAYKLIFLSEKSLKIEDESDALVDLISDVQFSPTATRVFNLLEKMSLKNLEFITSE